MKIEVLQSSPHSPTRLQYLTSFLVDDVVSIDAGALGLMRTPAEQARVRDVLLTHSHADHTGLLPIFLENVIDERREPPTVHAHPFTLATLRQDMFNDRMWPNFVDLRIGEQRLVKLHVLEAEKPFVIAAGTLTCTPILVDHPVPTFGFLLDDGRDAVLFSGDTGPTTRLWEIARATPRLRAVFLELSFPDERSELARRVGHLTPKTFVEELAKLDRPELQVFAFHLKAKWHATIVDELTQRLAKGTTHRADRVAIAELGREYRFGG
ncbi:MAG: 3',5'-cyclic-nucleotide phosphodiesterase [Planctomycetes bacterium]|nr:3',5'-cyclic-nucleotide phosphodiesterase [Planctomycetota bacterium]